MSTKRDVLVNEYLEAAATGDLDGLMECMNDYDIDVDTRGNVDSLGSTALHNACWYGRMNIVKYLIEERYANVEKKDYNGKRPLQFACRTGRYRIVNYLIKDCHANISWDDDDDDDDDDECIDYIQGNNEGWTALHEASIANHLNIVRYLITKCRNKVNVEAKNSTGETSLDVAIRLGNYDVAKYLIKEGDVNLETTNGRERTILHTATKEGRLKIVQYLTRKCNFNVNVQDFMGNTPLHLACFSGHWDIMKYLIDECNANIAIKTVMGETIRDSAEQIHGYVDGIDEFIPQLTIPKKRNTMVKEIIHAVKESPTVVVNENINDNINQVCTFIIVRVFL
jgi:ankyrin repeat protein